MALHKYPNLPAAASKGVATSLAARKRKKLMGALKGSKGISRAKEAGASPKVY